MFILGISIYFGLAISKWTQNNRHQIKFGHPEVDFIFQIILGTGMFIAALISGVLDNTIPGSDEERGIAVASTSKQFQNELLANTPIDFELKELVQRTYDLPYGMNIIRRYKFLESVPISPTFKGVNGLGRRGIYTLGVVSTILLVGYVTALTLI